MDDKKPLLGLTLNKITEITAQIGVPKFVAKQIVDWLYKKNVSNIDQMTNLSKKVREQLSTEYCVGKYPPEKETVSTDGQKNTSTEFVTEGLSKQHTYPIATVPHYAYRCRQDAKWDANSATQDFKDLEGISPRKKLLTR